MKAITLPGGSPSLAADVARPVPRAGEVLVRVSHSSVNAHEFELAAKPYIRVSRRLAGYRSRVRTGLEFSGWVESEGSRFRPGTRVMGYVDMTRGHNSHAEWLAIAESQLVAVPSAVSLAEATSLPMSAQTALVALRDVAKVRSGQKILVFGASGGVGLCMVQLARHLGVRVTAVARARHHQKLRELGAGEVVDYKQEPVAQMKGGYDAIVELSDSLGYSDVAHLLSPGAVFIPADPVAHLWEILTRTAARWLLVDKGRRQLLEEILQLVGQGVLVPQVAAEFSIESWEQALAQSRSRDQLGRVLLRFTTREGA